MNPVEQIKGIKDVKRLAQLIVQRSYSKNEDIDLLQNNGYDEDCATAYMDGYVDGLSHVLSFIYPKLDFESYIESMIKNPVKDINIETIKPGMIIASKKVPDFWNNLNLVLSVQTITEGVSVTFAALVCEDYLENKYRYERKYEVEISGLPTLYPQKLAIDLGTMYPTTMKQSQCNDIGKYFSIIHQIPEEQVNEIIKAYEAYDKEMGELYDIATRESK